MGDQLDIRTRGGLTVFPDDSTSIDNFDHRKQPALLVYVAGAKYPQPQEVLAELEPSEL